MFSLVLENNLGVPIGESSCEEDDRPVNGIIVKENNLSLPPRPLYLYKFKAVIKTVIV